MELTMEAMTAENLIGDIEVIEQQDEIEIQGGSLETSHGHGHAADEGVVDAVGIEIGNDAREDFCEVHGRN